MENKKLKVLFVSSGNSKKGISPIIKAQGESLKEIGIKIDYYSVIGRGFWGYLSNIIPLRQLLKKKHYDIIHSHYSLSSYVASLSKVGMNIPQVTSLMGCDINKSSFIKTFFLMFFSAVSWSSLIVKSEQMKIKSGLKNLSIIPNGVNLNKFKSSKDVTNLIKMNKKKRIIWISDPNRTEKNIQLAKNAIKLITKFETDLAIMNNIPHEDIVQSLNISDILLLTSIREGSPNVIKEAMACNLPVVATNVGDVKWLFGDEPGYFLCSFDPEDVAKKIEFAIEFKEKQGRTNGRQRIIKLGLDSDTIARKIVTIYKTVVK